MKVKDKKRKEQRHILALQLLTLWDMDFNNNPDGITLTEWTGSEEYSTILKDEIAELKKQNEAVKDALSNLEGLIVKHFLGEYDRIDRMIKYLEDMF